MDNGRNMVISTTSVANEVVKMLFSIISKRGKKLLQDIGDVTETCQAKRELQYLEPSIARLSFRSTLNDMESTMLKILLFEAASKISSSQRLLNSDSCDRSVFESTLATDLGVSIVGSVETLKYRPGLPSIH